MKNVQANELLENMPVEFSNAFKNVNRVSADMWLNGIPVDALDSDEFKSVMAAIDAAGKEKGAVILAALVTLITASNHI